MNSTFTLINDHWHGAWSIIGPHLQARLAMEQIMTMTMTTYSATVMTAKEAGRVWGWRGGAAEHNIGYGTGRRRLWFVTGENGMGGMAGWRSGHWHPTTVVTDTPIWASILLSYVRWMMPTWWRCKHRWPRCCQNQHGLVQPVPGLPMTLTVMHPPFSTWGNTVIKSISFSDVITTTTNNNNNPPFPYPPHPAPSTNCMTTITPISLFSIMGNLMVVAISPGECRNGLEGASRRVRWRSGPQQPMNEVANTVF